jgi:hypothetical protein
MAVFNYYPYSQNEGKVREQDLRKKGEENLISLPFSKAAS